MTRALTLQVTTEDADGAISSVRRGTAAGHLLAITGLLICAAGHAVAAIESPELPAAGPVKAATAAPASAPAGTAESPPFDAMEFDIRGATLLDREEIEEAVYPYLGPDRTADDVEQARSALEHVYRRKGYETVVVSIPPQDPSSGAIRLQVTELKVGRLRVRGAQYHSPEQIKAELPALAEGQVPNLKQAEQQLIAVNQQPDRRVFPELRAGKTPGTVDVDLKVEDDLPLHGSIELNNRRSEDTTPLRLVTSLRYDNLWQLGHSISFSQQVAPERPSDAQVYSGSYLARFPQLPGLAFLVYGYTSNSQVATVGSTDVIGNGKAVGGRVIKTLPGTATLFQTLSGGVDYKDFDENVSLGGSETQTPITYYPFTVSYNASLTHEKSTTNLGTDVVFTFRGLGSGNEEFDQKRYEASDSFIYLRATADHTQTLPYDMALFGRFEGQVSSGPLVSNEQLAVGGLDTVRGFLEAIVLGDYGVIGSLELRSPSIGQSIDKRVNDWRFYTFFDAATASIYQPLPGQQQTYNLASVGIGSSVRLLDALNGALDLAFPILSNGVNAKNGQTVLFRVWGEM